MNDENLRDYTRRVGSAAIGGRLRRLVEFIDEDSVRFYRSHGVKFEQRWFGLINQLVLNGPMSVSEISEALGITHVSISQARKSLEHEGLLSSAPDPSDGRRRILQLTPAGIEMVEKMEPFWQAFEAAAVKLNSDAGDVMASLDRLEDALGEQSMFERIIAELGDELATSASG